VSGYNNNVLYNERNDQLLLRQEERLCCINLDGHVIYRYDISGYYGLAVDQQGHVYICGADDIHRLSPDGTFRDIVLSKHDGVDSKNPSFTKKYKNPSFTKKYKNPSFTKKYKNPSFTKNIKILHLQKNIKILHLQKNIKILHLRKNIKIIHSLTGQGV
jgi:hypothetical protein